MKVLVMLPLAAAGLVAFAGNGNADRGKDNKKVEEIAVYNAQWELPDGNKFLKALIVKSTDEIPKYLEVIYSIDDPATSFWAGIDKTKSLSFQVSTVNEKEGTHDANRFYIDVKDLTQAGTLSIADITDLIVYAPKSFHGLIPAEFRNSKINIPLTASMVDGKFMIKSDLPESPVQIDGMTATYDKAVFSIVNIDVDRNGVTSYDGETYSVNELSGIIKNSMPSETASDNLYFTVLNTDAETRWGKINNIKDTLRNKGIYNITYDYPQTMAGVNIAIESTEAVPLPSAISEDRTMPYYVGYGYSDEKTAKQHLIEISIKGSDISIGNENVPLKNVEAKINQTAAAAGATGADMIIGVRPDDNAEMGIVKSVKAIGAKQRPRALVVVRQNPE